MEFEELKALAGQAYEEPCRLSGERSCHGLGNGVRGTIEGRADVMVAREKVQAAKVEGDRNAVTEAEAEYADIADLARRQHAVAQAVESYESAYDRDDEDDMPRRGTTGRLRTTRPGRETNWKWLHGTGWRESGTMRKSGSVAPTRRKVGQRLLTTAG